MRYWAACTDSTSVASQTIVICCPTTSQADGSPIKLSCADTSRVIPEGWATLLCTWQAPKDTVTITYLGTDPRKDVYTEVGPIHSPDGIDAYGVRMLYKAADLSLAQTSAVVPTASDTANAANTLPSNGTFTDGAGEVSQPEKSEGLQPALIAAICVSAVLGVILLLGAGLFFARWRRRRQQRLQQKQQLQGPSLTAEGGGLGVVPKPELPGTPSQSPVELPTGRDAFEKDGTEVLAELPG
ncbi:hypothetical protein VTJ04DRAFT_6214 [Mycothermus thermophilus]|uniref:uncharacterized protein n=1 Tax=Humicola insolens TaxID=85995 RepID=UPI003743966E